VSVPDVSRGDLADQRECWLESWNEDGGLGGIGREVKKTREWTHFDIC